MPFVALTPLVAVCILSPAIFPAAPAESSQTIKSAIQSKSLLREMRRINAPFNDYRLIRFDTAVHI
jgi:hypothetical protein